VSASTQHPSLRTLAAAAAFLAALVAVSAQEPAPAPAPGSTAPPAPGAARVADLVDQGNAARQAGRLAEAVDAYRAAAALDPGRYEIRILIGDTLRRLGHDTEAAAAYEEAVRINPARPTAYTGQALLRRAVYDYDGAAAVVQQGLARAAGPDRADLLVSLGETRRREGRRQEATDLFVRALTADASTVAAHAGLARLAEDRGDLDAAVAQWDLYLEDRPDDGAAELRRQELREVRASVGAVRAAAGGPAGAGAAGTEVWAELGRLLAVTGDQAGAADAWRGTLRRDPASVAARRGLALALESQGDAKAAASECRKLLRSQPADGTALYHLVALAHAGSDPRAEEAAWIELVTRRPDDLYAAGGLAQFVARAGAGARDRILAATTGLPAAAGHRLKAVLLADAGDWAGAAGALYDALRLDPTEPWTLEILNDLLYRRPPLLAELGERAAREAAAAPPDNPLPVLLLARLTAMAGHDPQALSLVRGAVSAAPSSAPAHASLAELLPRAGREPAEALEELARTVDLDPGRAAAHVDLALALLRAGRPEDAEAAARRGLERHAGSGPLLSLLGAALADRGDREGAAAAYAAALIADPADNFHLARSQYAMTLAALGRSLEARRALAGTLPEFPALAYREAWAFARDTSRDRTFHGQDWLSWRDRYDGNLATTASAHNAIATMLASLGDPYTRLRDPDETAAVYLTRHGGRGGTDLLGRNRPHGDTVVSGDLPGNLGYIQIGNLTDPNAVAEVRRALEALREKDGIVIDLRGNTGGLTRSADEVADLLVGPGKETGVDVTPEGATHRISGGSGAVTHQPVTVIVDGQTGSAAERLAASLDMAGRATLLGEPTFGKGLFQNTRVLPGGHMVLVSAGEALGPDGRPIQGRGLRPRPRAPAEESPPH
jgi:C-terminal processing protease CtpA/Prc/Tfp pilus assembly protein PilF